MEYMITDMLSGWNFTTMYETEGIDGSSYDCDISLNNANVVSEWSSGQYGVVNWWAHGSSSAVYRKYWSWDDGDMVPETSSPDEIDMPPFLYGHHHRMKSICPHFCMGPMRLLLMMTTPR